MRSTSNVWLCVLMCLCESPQFLSNVRQHSKDDRDVSHPGRTRTRVHCSNVSRSAFSLDGLAVFWSKWKRVSLQRATLTWRTRACRTRVEKGATRSIATGMAIVNVGSSKTDIVGEKIESETCRPSTSTSRNERVDLVYSASRVKGPPRHRLCCAAPTSKVKGASRFCCVGDYHARQSGLSGFGTMMKQTSEILVARSLGNFNVIPANDAESCWTDLSFDRDTLQTNRRRAKIDANFATGVSKLRVVLLFEDFYLACIATHSLHVEAEASLYSFRDQWASKSMTS